MEQYAITADHRHIQRRMGYLFIGVLIIFAFMLMRVWYLQIPRGKYYTKMSESNRIRIVPLQPRRGFILDRSSRLLATYKPSFNLYLILEDIPDRDVLIGKLSNLLNQSESEIEVNLEQRKPIIPYLPVKIKEDLSLREVALLEAHQLDLPGVRIQAEPQRYYIYGRLAAHTLGYVGEVTATQLEEPEYKGILPGTVVGKYGVEHLYDRFLRAESGKKVIEVDAIGHEVKQLERREPHPSHDVYLTIDLELQQVAEKALENRPGAIVAIDPNNGEILVMTSQPAFDPNQLSRGMTSKEWQLISQDPDHQLTNRATQGQYPPGSIFKLIVAASALESGRIDSDYFQTCRGGLRFGGRIYKDWKRGGHGEMDLHSAIVQSCDVLFYHLGRTLGVDLISEYAFLFGLGQLTGIELLSEKKGLIPTKAWKRKTRQEPWYPGENLSAAIGQGYISVTPLQMANMIAAFAKDGVRYKPHIVKAVRGRLDEEWIQTPIIRLEDINIQKKTFDYIREAISGVVVEKNGTGRRAYSQMISIAGKTGTAQVVAIKPGTKTEDLPKKLQDHAWFVAFAPVEDPKIAIAVLLENGGSGGKEAAPVAKKIIEAFFRNDEQKTPQQL